MNIQKIAEKLVDGTCMKKFKQMPSKKQQDVALKVAGVALAAGLLTALVTVPFSALAAAILIPIVAIAASTSAFAYLTFDYSLLRTVRDHGNAAIDTLEETLDQVSGNVSQCINGTFSSSSSSSSASQGPTLEEIQQADAVRRGDARATARGNGNALRAKWDITLKPSVSKTS